MRLKLSFVTNSSSSSFVAFVVDRGQVADAITDKAWLDLFNDMFEYRKRRLAKDPSYSYNVETVKAMSAAETDEAKIQYAKDNFDNESVFNGLVPGFGAHSGEYDNSYYGIELSTLMKEYPDLKLGNLATELAKIVNEKLGTHIEKFGFVEESGYHG